MTSIKTEFLKTVSNYTPNPEVQNLLWDEVEKAYSNKKRFYHTLSHLDNLLHELLSIKNQFSDWDILVFAIAYHDIVYNVVKSDNEERSAQYAEIKLRGIGLDTEAIGLCENFIQATKKHLPVNREIDLFTDADLSILGSEIDVYKEYTENIRKEYSIFPSLIYNPGRKKVVMHFLKMDRIFKTNEFYTKYEVQARQNLEAEWLSLK